MIAILENKSIWHKLNFTYESKINALLSKPEMFYLIEPGDEPRNKDDQLLVGVFGSPFLWQQNKIPGILYTIDRFKEQKWHIIEDMHDFTFRRGYRDYYRDKNIIFTYINNIEHSRFACAQQIFIPHHIDTDIFYASGLSLARTIDVLVYGKLGGAYPERIEWIKKLRQQGREITIVPHPGYSSLSHDINRKNLADLIRSSNSVLVSGSIYKYLVAKFFEVDACRIQKLGPDWDMWRTYIYNYHDSDGYDLKSYIKKITKVFK